MNFNQLKIFHVVAIHKSFSLAAKNLLLTQPDVSIQIRLLEESLGVKLIQKAGKHLELTDAGKVLFSYSRRIFELSEEAEAIVADYKTLRQGTLKICTTRTIARYYLPAILSNFKKGYPNIRIFLKAENSFEALNGVLSFESDIAITGRIPYDDKLLAIPFISDKLVFIGSPKDELFKGKKIDLRKLTGKPIITRENGSLLKKMTLEIFQEEGISPNIIMELGNCDTIKKLVEDRIGFSIMTFTMVKDEVKTGILKAVDISHTSENGFRHRIS